MKLLLSVSMCSLLLIFLSCQKETEDAVSERLPNFILIMADDLGYGGLSCYGNPTINTPNLDRMAAEGIRFTDYYANSTVCTPTRAAMMTGRYQQRSGLEGVIYVRGETREVGMAQEEVTIAELLKAKGYATGIMGKWHLGYKKEFFPVHQGFDQFYGYVSGNIDFHTHYDNAGIFDWYHNLDSLDEQGYVTDLITQHSINFIRANKDQPFFLYIPHEAPHAPFQGRKDPGYRFPGQKFTYYGPVEDKEAAYIEMVEVMDEGIGKLFSVLKTLNLEENTLVVFVSDNGAESLFQYNNGSLRGAKTNLYEGGIRVPAIAWWKGKIQPMVSSEVIMSFDWMPTFLSLSKTDLPDNLELDGIDLSSLLLQNEPLRNRTLFWKYRNQKAVRAGKWKLLTEKDTINLFDLHADIEESVNQADQNPAIVKELVSKLKRWEQEVAGAKTMITN